MDSQLIRLVNRLQDCFNCVGLPNTIDLPQITVVGSQSSGKSSVLENIVGRDFLPRGSGIVTRRPLVLQLINRSRTPIPTPTSSTTSVNEEKKSEKDEIASPGNNKDEWGEFLHVPGKKFFDFQEICKEIVRDTEEKTGGNLGISDLPINLRIFSPNVLTLTLVDLPGITKVPVGNQPPDIEVQIRKMILRYINKPNAIILAVTAANADLANSDALKMAREVDPNCLRTIGVLTKIDLMDQDTNVIDILAGRVIPLRLGYVPVVNRGQRDIDRRKPISQAIESERMFFEGHDAYSSKAKYCGTPYLTQKLNAILLHHIKETLPDIRQRISTQLIKVKTDLAQMGGVVDVGADSDSNFVLSVITEFCNEFSSIIDGNSSDILANELIGGARISHLFHEIFRNHIDSIDPFDQVKDADIRTMNHNSSGSQPSVFWGTRAFEVIVKQQVKRLEEPSIRCVQLVYEELIRILNTLLQRQAFVRFPDLRDKVSSIMINYLRQNVIPTNKLVSDIVSAEMCYVNTRHPDFITGPRATALVTERINPQKQGGVNGHSGGASGLAAPPGLSILGTAERPSVPPRGSGAQPGSNQQQQTQQQGQYGSSVMGGYNTAGLIGNSAAPDYIPGSAEDNGMFGMFGKRTSKRSGAGANLDAPPQILRPEGKMSEQEREATEVVKVLLSSYFNIVKRTVKDLCPKCIMLNLVNYTKENMQRTLLTELYNKEVLETVLKESEHIVQRRKELRNLLKALESAEEIVKTVV